MSSHQRLMLLSACLLLVVATSVGQNHDLIPASLVHELFHQHPSLMLQRQMDAPSLVEMIMIGLAGIPVYKAMGMLLPFLVNRKGGQQKDVGRVYQKRRQRRDIAYANQLLDLLLSVEKSLEKYGVTEPQCQLRATCDIHRKSANAIGPNNHEKNFIKLVDEMRKEIQNPRVIPLAKYVFEYYEEAAVRGETQCDCKELYSRCPYSWEQMKRKKKGKKPPRSTRRPTRSVQILEEQQRLL